MTKIVQSQMNQMIMFSANFSLHACWTSIRFIHPNHLRKGVGHQKVSIQHAATPLLQKDLVVRVMEHIPRRSIRFGTEVGQAVIAVARQRTMSVIVIVPEGFVFVPGLCASRYFGCLVSLCRQRFTSCEFRSTSCEFQSGSFGVPALFSAFPHFSTSGLHGKNCFADVNDDGCGTSSLPTLPI